MWTNVVVSQLLDKLLLERRRNGMFQTLCFLVDFVPWHPKDLREHALN